MKPLFIRLAGPPRGKGRPRMGPNNVVYTDAKTRVYEESLALIARAAMRSREKFSGPLQVDMVAFFSVPASWSEAKRRDALTGHLRPLCKPDADNIAKMMDALNGIVWSDDALTCDVTVRKFFAAEPSLLVCVQAATLGMVP